MRLEIVTPLGVVHQVSGVEHLLAEDATGLFGVRQGHGDFVTVLNASVLSWRLAAGGEGHAAVRGGVLLVRKLGGEVRVEVATREAMVSEDLAALESLVEASFRAEEAVEEQSRGQAARLHAAVYRGVLRYLRPEESMAGAPVLSRGKGLR